MSEHLSGQVVKSYRERLLSPAQLLEAHDHIGVCEICRLGLFEIERFAAEVSKPGITINNLADIVPEHPGFEDFVAYVDDQLDTTDLEIVRSHIELCQVCADELRDLIVFKAALANAPDEPTIVETAASPKTKLRRRWSFFQQWSQAGVFAVSLVFITVVVWIALRADTSREIEMVKLGPTAPATEIGDAQILPLAAKTKSSAKEVTIVLKDGGRRVTIDTAGNITGLEFLSLDHQATVRKALTKQKIQTSDAVADLVGRSEVLMGTPENSVSFSLTTPVGTVVKSDRPVFGWHSLAGATSYTVHVFDSDFRKVATSPALSIPEWKIEKSLEPGHIYSWQVIAVTAEGTEITSPTAPAPEAKFKVLEQGQAHTLRRAQQDFGRSHLAMGLLYSREGLLEDAEREFRALFRDNPRSSLARKFLREVWTARRKR